MVEAGVKTRETIKAHKICFIQIKINITVPIQLCWYNLSDRNINLKIFSRKGKVCFYDPPMKGEGWALCGFKFS